MRFYADLSQYLLTASMLVPHVAVGYGLSVLLAKLVARIGGDRFEMRGWAHLAVLVVASAAAPLVALFVIQKPIDLIEKPWTAFGIGGLTAFSIVVALEPEIRRRRDKPKR